MIAYFLLWIFSITFILAAQDPKYTSWFITIIGIVLILFFGLRPISLGSDTQAYQDIYDGWNQGILQTGLEPVFSAIIVILKSFNLSARSLFIFISLVFNGIIILVFTKYFKKHNIIILLLIASFPYWSFNINVLRSGLAWSIFFLATALWAQNRKSLIPLLCLIAMGIHITIAIPFFILLFSRVPLRILDHFFIPILLGILLYSLFIGNLKEIILVVNHLPFLPERLVYKLSMYINATYEATELKIGISYFSMLFITIFSYLNRQKIYSYYQQRQDIKFRLFIELSLYLTMIYLLTYPLLYFHHVFARITMYFSPFFTIVLYAVISSFFTYRDKLILIIGLSSVLYLKFIYTGYLNDFLTNY